MIRLSRSGENNEYLPNTCLPAPIPIGGPPGRPPSGARRPLRIPRCGLGRGHGLVADPIGIQARAGGHWRRSEHRQWQLAHRALSRQLSWLLGLVLLASCWLLPLAAAPGEAQALEAPTCAPITESQVQGLFERWNRALSSGNPETVARLYEPGALLLPTLSATDRSGTEAIADYFTAFLKRQPTGEVTSRQIRLGCNQASDAGDYRFDLHQPEEQLDARYTFVYGFDGQQWRIVHHHSSLVPQIGQPG